MEKCLLLFVLKRREAESSSGLRAGTVHGDQGADVLLIPLTHRWDTSAQG